MRLIEKIDSLYKDVLVRATHILAVGALTYPIHLIYRKNPLYHMSGGLSFVIGRTLDYLSTIPLIELINKPEFKESNLGEEYYETNPLLGKHPTIKEHKIKSVFIDLLGLGFCALFPPAGYAYLSQSPIIFYHNKKVKKKLEKDLEKISSKN